MTTQKSAKPRLLQLSAPQPSSPPASWLSATLFFFARGMPQKWRKSKPEIYASFNCCSCMRFKAKAIIVRSCVASPLGTGALDTSALAAPMACNGRMSRKNKKNTTPKKFPWIPQIMACAICRNSRNNFFNWHFKLTVAGLRVWRLFHYRLCSLEALRLLRDDFGLQRRLPHIAVHTKSLQKSKENFILWRNPTSQNWCTNNSPGPAPQKKIV